MLFTKYLGVAGRLQAPGLIMLKKIWVNASPGEDEEADKYFHFPQVCDIMSLSISLATIRGSECFKVIKKSVLN